jgi:hypothetical protein
VLNSKCPKKRIPWRFLNGALLHCFPPRITCPTALSKLKFFGSITAIINPKTVKLEI